MKEYYHGTEAQFLHSILKNGFNLERVRHGRVSGNGVYVSTKPETVAYWAPQSYVTKKSYAIKCSLDQGTRILWKDFDYDRKIIAHLEKEFSKRISKDFDFWKYIPSNKKLTGRELRALLSHLDTIRSITWSKKKERLETKFRKNMSRLGKLIRGYGYDALGDRTESAWDTDEIMVFNPSRVSVVSIHEVDVWWEGGEPMSVSFSGPLSEEQIKDISEADKADWDAYNKKCDEAENCEES